MAPFLIAWNFGFFVFDVICAIVYPDMAVYFGAFAAFMLVMLVLSVVMYVDQRRW